MPSPPAVLDATPLTGIFFTSRVEEAILHWKNVLGEEHVLTEPNVLRRAETATFLTRQSVPAILRPANRGELQEVVRIASRFQVPLYPVSTGKNWGYGSSVPASAGCVLVELRRMNRILEYNEDLAYVTVEPGVTQRQLREFLDSRKSRLWMDATGASPECSLIGNAVERGFGHTPYGDHFAHTCGLEVVLANGDIVETGFSGWSAAAGPVYRWGVGPSLDGIFSQSNLGIVTRMTFWLMPMPECFQAFFFRCDHPEALGPLTDALRTLKLEGTLRSTVHIANDYKVLSGIQQYPWVETAGETPLREPHMAGFRRRFQFGFWNGSGGLYGTRAQVAASRRRIRQVLGDRVTRIQFLGERKLRLAARSAKLYQWFTGWDLNRTLELARPVMDLLRGLPTTGTLRSVYWRKTEPPPPNPDPDRDGCGLIWCSPIAPLDGGHAEAVTEIASQTLMDHGFEPILSLSAVGDRALACVASICYDRLVPGEDEQAKACHSALLSELLRAGYPPYRLGNGSLEAWPEPSVRVIRAIKRTLDPAGILAPGRYES